jgi:hypothetical protein
MSKITRTVTITAVCYAILFTLFAGICIAAGDRIVTGTLKAVTVATDKNGKEYVRLILPEEKVLNGIKYTGESLVMAFGNTVAQAKLLKAGQPVKMIVNTRPSKDGRESTTVIAIVK